MISKKKGTVSKRYIQKKVCSSWKTQIGYYLMFAGPAFCMILFNYIPMLGIYMAFIDYKPAKGFFGSKFIGLNNFIEFFDSIDFIRVFRNTVGYNLGRILIVNLLAGMILALLLYEIKSRVGNKIYHTCMLLPSFISWTVVSASLLIILHPDHGIINKFLEMSGMQSVGWYSQATYWPVIIILAMIYKDGGMASVYFYSALLGIDTELFDAANIDGAGRLKQIWYISLPAMQKVFCITLIAALGGTLSGTISPYYELTFNNGVLYETTLVLGTYLYNGIGGGRFSFMTAVGLVQSMVGLILVIISNIIVKHVDPESAMF